MPDDVQNPTDVSLRTNIEVPNLAELSDQIKDQIEEALESVKASQVDILDPPEKAVKDVSEQVATSIAGIGPSIQEAMEELFKQIKHREPEEKLEGEEDKTFGGELERRLTELMDEALRHVREHAPARTRDMEALTEVLKDYIKKWRGMEETGALPTPAAPTETAETSGAESVTSVLGETLGPTFGKLAKPLVKLIDKVDVIESSALSITKHSGATATAVQGLKGVVSLIKSGIASLEKHLDPMKKILSVGFQTAMSPLRKLGISMAFELLPLMRTINSIVLDIVSWVRPFLKMVTGYINRNKWTIWAGFLGMLIMKVVTPGWILVKEGYKTNLLLSSIHAALLQQTGEGAAEAAVEGSGGGPIRRALGKATKKIGGWLGEFGSQFKTGFTKVFTAIGRGFAGLGRGTSKGIGKVLRKMGKMIGWLSRFQILSSIGNAIMTIGIVIGKIASTVVSVLGVISGVGAAIATLVAIVSLALWWWKDSDEKGEKIALERLKKLGDIGKKVTEARRREQYKADRMPWAYQKGRLMEGGKRAWEDVFREAGLIEVGEKLDMSAAVLQVLGKNTDLLGKISEPLREGEDIDKKTLVEGLKEIDIKEVKSLKDRAEDPSTKRNLRDFISLLKSASTENLETKFDNLYTMGAEKLEDLLRQFKKLAKKRETEAAAKRRMEKRRAPLYY